MPEEPKFVAAPLADRPPTSHEQMSGRPWDASYQDGPAPWDIGQPQPAIARLAPSGGFRGPVLDAGCGTGENSLLVASLGHSVLGVDVAETALAMARQKAARRGIAAEFAAADALHLDRLGRRFRTVLDCGLFHTFNAEERTRYVASVARVTEPGGTLYVLCFRAAGADSGPHPVHEDEIRGAYQSSVGWDIADLAPNLIHTRFREAGIPAWLARIHRVQQEPGRKNG
jgi:SAM-dependent methyltransferase